MTNDDHKSNRRKIAETIAIIARASADADAAAHQPGRNDARFSSDVWQREFMLRTGLELSRCEVQSLLTAAVSDPVPGNQKRKPEICWHPAWMLHEAAMLGQAAERLDAPEKDRADHFDRSPIAVPVLLALATELALKALQWNERDGRNPAQTHDLLARLPQLEGFEVRNPLIFLNPTPKGRHYTAADGQRVARRHEESRGAPCAGRVMPSWCSRSSCSFLGWV